MKGHGPALGEPLPPDWAGHPPQMSANDMNLWVRFRESYAQEFKNFYFDCHVGDPVLEAPDLEEEMQRVVEAVSRRRIDVVGEKENEWWLIELRQNAGPGAIGSILTYKTLWEEDPPDKRLVTPIIVTDYTDKNLVRVCSKLNIIYLLV